MSKAIGKPARDYVFNVIVKDSAGNPVNLNTVSGLALVAFINLQKIVCQWSLNTVDGYVDIVVVDATIGLVKILLRKEKTMDVNDVQLYIETIPQVLDSDFGQLQLSSLDGKNEELIYLTNTPKTKLPNLI